MATSKKIPAFLGGLVAGAISTWFQPYNELEIYGVDFRIITAIAAVLIAFAHRYWTGAGTMKTGIWVGFGILAALVLRILFDSFFGGSGHSIWLLEISLFVVIVFPSAFIGAYLAELLQWKKQKRT